MALEAVHLAGLARIAERLARKRGLEADEDSDEDEVRSVDGSRASRAIPVMTPPRYKAIEKGLAPLEEAGAKKVRTTVTCDSELPVDAPMISGYRGGGVEPVFPFLELWVNSSAVGISLPCVDRQPVRTGGSRSHADPDHGAGAAEAG